MSSEIEKQRSGGFIFTWTIHNFSHCALKRNESFLSPSFVVESLGDVFWHLSIIPKVYKVGFFNCFLFKDKECSTWVYTLSVLKNDGTMEVIRNDSSPGSIPSSASASFKKISINEMKYFFNNDSLTVQCQMWKKDEPNQPLVFCRARTEVMVSKINYIWTLYDIVENLFDLTYKFNHSTEVPVRISSAPSVKISTTNGGSNGEDAIYFGVQIPELKENVFLVCGIHFLDAQKRVTYSARAERLFEAQSKSEVWHFKLISKDELYSYKTLYLDNDQLVLQCEFSFSGRDVAHKIEYGTPNALQKQTPPSPMSRAQEIWNRNLGAFYSEGKLSNVVLQSSDRKEFPAHREFLSAHSEVFQAMFEHDTEEQNSGVVEIGDVEGDIVDKMLKFVYTGTVEGVDHSVARKLYYAADKYRIESLLEICSNNLANDMDVSNVCDVLILADRHHDEKLKSQVKDFFYNNIYEVVNSAYWKSFQETNSQLAFGMMDWLMRSKFPEP